MVFEFIRRSSCYLNETSHLRIRPPSASLGDVRSDRSGRSPNLTGQSVDFFLREVTRPLIDDQCNFVSFSPNFQVLEVFHRQLPFRLARSQELEANSSRLKALHKV